MLHQTTGLSPGSSPSRIYESRLLLMKLQTPLLGAIDSVGGKALRMLYVLRQRYCQKAHMSLADSCS